MKEAEQVNLLLEVEKLKQARAEDKALMAELLGFKKTQEEERNARLGKFVNEVNEYLIKNNATISETLAVLAMLTEQHSDNSGSPNALLVSATAACVNAWNTINVSDVSIVSGTYYWIGHNTDNYYLPAYNSGGTAKYKSATYSTFSFPDPAGTGFTNDTWTFAHAGWGAESAAGNPLLIYAQQ